MVRLRLISRKGMIYFKKPINGDVDGLFLLGKRLPSRMSLMVGVSEMFEGKMCIDLGGCRRSVPKEFLDCA